jgi:uncharacterized RDD family membrane protein YckC
MSTWYYSDTQRNRLGPVAATDLVQLHDNGQLAPEVLVWREGMPDWKPWREVMDEVLGRAPAPTARATFAVASADAPATASGNPYEIVDRTSPYSAPRAAVDQAMGWHAGGEVVYAGFWKRAAAVFIDSLLVTLAFYAVAVVLAIAGVVSLSSLAGEGGGMAAAMWMGGLYLAYPILSATYYVGMETSGAQATLGKMAVGIKVTDTEGRPLTRGRALARWASHLICYLTIYIGYIVAAFTERKQGLHEMVAGTLVVDRWAYTAHPERQRRELGTVTIVVLALAGLLIVGYFVLIGLAIALAGMAGAG